MSLKATRRVPIVRKIKLQAKQKLPEPAVSMPVHFPPLLNVHSKENLRFKSFEELDDDISLEELSSSLPRYSPAYTRFNSAPRESQSRTSSIEQTYGWEDGLPTWEDHDYWDDEDTEASELSHSADSFMSWTDEVEVEATKKVQAMYDEVERFLYDEGPPTNLRPDLVEECLQWKSKFKYLRVSGDPIKTSSFTKVDNSDESEEESDEEVIAYDSDSDSDNTIIAENEPHRERRESVAFIPLSEDKTHLEYDDVIMGSKRVVDQKDLEENVKKYVYDGLFDHVWPRLKEMKSKGTLFRLDHTRTPRNSVYSRPLGEEEVKPVTERPQRKNASMALNINQSLDLKSLLVGDEKPQRKNASLSSNLPPPLNDIMNPAPETEVVPFSERLRRRNASVISIGPLDAILKADASTPSNPTVDVTEASQLMERRYRRNVSIMSLAPPPLDQIAESAESVEPEDKPLFRKNASISSQNHPDVKTATDSAKVPAEQSPIMDRRFRRNVSIMSLGPPPLDQITESAEAAETKEERGTRRERKNASITSQELRTSVESSTSTQVSERLQRKNTSTASPVPSDLSSKSADAPPGSDQSSTDASGEAQKKDATSTETTSKNTGLSSFFGSAFKNVRMFKKSIQNNVPPENIDSATPSKNDSVSSVGLVSKNDSVSSIAPASKTTSISSVGLPHKNDSMSSMSLPSMSLTSKNESVSSISLESKISPMGLPPKNPNMSSIGLPPKNPGLPPKNPGLPPKSTASKNDTTSVSSRDLTSKSDAPTVPSSTSGTESNDITDGSQKKNASITSTLSMVVQSTTVKEPKKTPRTASSPSMLAQTATDSPKSTKPSAGPVTGILASRPPSIDSSKSVAGSPLHVHFEPAESRAYHSAVNRPTAKTLERTVSSFSTGYEGTSRKDEILRNLREEREKLAANSGVKAKPVNGLSARTKVPNVTLPPINKFKSKTKAMSKEMNAAKPFVLHGSGVTKKDLSKQLGDRVTATPNKMELKGGIPLSSQKVLKAFTKH